MSISSFDSVPWDIYVDERKTPGDAALGFLEVPNTASFMHKLYRCRQHPPSADGRTTESREVHFHRLHRGVIRVAFAWIDAVFRHNGAVFTMMPWPASVSKQDIVLRFLETFVTRRRLHRPSNVVVFLDHDTSHARAKIQNFIREHAGIVRCYHLDGAKNDCLQCCDLLLGCLALLRRNAGVIADFAELDQNWRLGNKLPDSACKRLAAGYLARKMAESPNKVYPSSVDIK